ncbi:MAG: hypothetical protein QW418_06230 [Candidatus Korarchaeum sp.]
MRTMRLAIATLLGIIAFISKSLLPPVIDKVFLLMEALSFALSSILVIRWGATYASFVNGMLLSIARIGLFPFSLIFSVLYGLLIDGTFEYFKVKSLEDGGVRIRTLPAVLSLSSIVTGLVALFSTTMLGVMPMIPFLYVVILVAGTFNGVAAGYLTSVIWNKYLSKHPSLLGSSWVYAI